MVNAATYRSIMLGNIRITYLPDGYILFNPTALFSSIQRPYSRQPPQRTGSPISTCSIAMVSLLAASVPICSRRQSMRY
ncbi:MAG TPA: hypothetical protein VL485_10485 [Ktedonobacteraceae bacterium]|nr:hypothetical protein [Ktedonobacteraceae bacterium]